MTNEKKEQVKKHKKSFEYMAGQFKYSAIVWTLGSGAIALSLWAAFFGLRRTVMVREVLVFLAVMVTWRFFRKLKLWIHYKDASVGVALGLDTDKRFLKNITALDKKIFKLEMKRAWYVNYLSEDAKAEVNKMDHELYKEIQEMKELLYHIGLKTGAIKIKEEEGGVVEEPEPERQNKVKEEKKEKVKEPTFSIED